jgi:hypothetical protein
MPCLTKSTKNEHFYEQLMNNIAMTSWANKEIFKRLLVLVSAADLVIPHGTPVTTASLPKGGVRRDLSILGDRPDVGKKYEKMCFK